jgi:hypothetical protein
VTQLEDLTKGALVRGVLGGCVVKVVDIARHGSRAPTFSHADELTGKAYLVYRENEARIVAQKAKRTRSMYTDGNLFRLVSDAEWMLLVYLVGPLLVVEASTLYLFPLRVESVYEKNPLRTHLRFLLADDLCVSKAIVAGLFCMEPMVQGDVERCLIVAPEGLAEQRQDEPRDKFALSFEILVKDLSEAIVSGGPFGKRSLPITRLDHTSRNKTLPRLPAVCGRAMA